MFLLMQNAEMVTNVTTIMAKAQMNPDLKASIFLTQAMGEKSANTISAKYSSWRSCILKSDSAVDLRPSMMNASCAIVN